MNLRNQKGINVITLAVAIIILVIITSVLVYNSKDSVRIRNVKDLYNDVEVLNNKVSAYYIEHGDIPKLNIPYKGDNDELPDFLSSAKSDEINPNDNGNYYVINLELLNGITLNYGKGFEEIKDSNNQNDIYAQKDVYIINEASHTVYYPKGVNLQGVKYHTYSDEWKNVTLSVVPISTPEHLANVGTDHEITINGVQYKFSKNATYVLKNDIDLSGVCYNDVSWTPICYRLNDAFEGKFYGNGHEIRGLYINNTKDDYQGLFGWNNGTIQDLTVEGSINGRLAMGGIVYANGENGKMERCTSNVKITAENEIGGIACENYGKIIECKNMNTLKETVSYSGFVGGIVGFNNNGSVEKSYNRGSIDSSGGSAGGIAGKNSGIVAQCVNNGPVKGAGDGVGGIARKQCE